jgi:hypothetical protein
MAATSSTSRTRISLERGMQTGCGSFSPARER